MKLIFRLFGGSQKAAHEADSENAFYQQTKREGMALKVKAEAEEKARIDAMTPAERKAREELRQDILEYAKRNRQAYLNTYLAVTEHDAAQQKAIQSSRLNGSISSRGGT